MTGISRKYVKGSSIRHRKQRSGFLSTLYAQRQLIVLSLPVVAYYIIFDYIPLYGIQIAFKDFVMIKGFFGSPWVGFKHFERFFESYRFWLVLKNTVLLSLYELFAGFPVPIVFALMLNQCHHLRFKKSVQTITYAPHFISTVVVVGMLYLFLSPSSGIVNYVLNAFGIKSVFFMGDERWFRHVYVLSAIWKNAGWGTIVYLASLSAVDPNLYEAATIDGASRIHKIIYIDFYAILPTLTILMILRMGRIISVGFQKAYLMQNDLNIRTSEIIATYVYKIGILQGQFSFGTAIGVFNNLVGLIMVLIVNSIARRVGETSLW